MATITGTSTDDILIGTDQDDLLLAMGGIDRLEGGLGADTYQLTQGPGTNVVTIADASQDGALDTITGGRGFYASASLGYSAWASAVRSGDDLTITLPGKPYRFRKAGFGPLTISIEDHYGNGTVERMQIGQDFFLLASLTEMRVTQNVLMAGDATDEYLTTGRGNDFISGNAGADVIRTSGGDDIAFGGEGNDVIRTGPGNDRAFGENGSDRVFVGGGNDEVRLGAGNDRAVGGTGADILLGERGDDVLFGQAGRDTLDGGLSGDRLLGGLDGDLYRFGYDPQTLSASGTWGHDTIRDRGDRATTYLNSDMIELYGFYGPSDGTRDQALAQLYVARNGNHMRLATIDGDSSITVKQQFATNPRYQIEQIKFNAGYWSALVFRIIDAGHHKIGDDRADKFGRGGEYNEVIFGTDESDSVFGDSGYNLIWLGGGADTLIYKESDPQLLYNLQSELIGGGAVTDIVMDFNPVEDQLDFTEIKGLGYGDLTITADAEGDTMIRWSSGDFQISSISIELRGVSVSDLTEAHFVFA